MNSRQAALKVLNRCFKDRGWSNQLLDSELDTLSELDRSFATKIALGVIQNYRLIDLMIDQFCGKLDLTVRNILRIGVYQIHFLAKIPNRAAVNECVELAKHSGYRSASGLINAVLRKICLEPIPETDDLSVKYSHPKWLVDKLVSDYGTEFTEKFLIANNSEPQIDYHKAFSDNKYVQDNAAYESVCMLSPCEGMNILDACAAPGGKSFTSAVLMNNKGHILSCDIHEKKLRLISDGAENLGINIIETRQMDASVYCSKLDSCFDAVIADVPCSGIGVIRKKPDIRLKEYDEIASLPEIQKNILSNLIRYLKPGGKLLYSTCTILKEENEGIAHNYNVIKEKTFWPHIDGTDGFYAAVIEK